MTIVTKPLSEKKNDKNAEPLVVDVSTEAEVPPPNWASRQATLRELVRDRRSNTWPTASVFIVALFVLSLGVLTGVSVYNHFVRAQVSRYHEWCNVSINENEMRQALEGLPMLDQVYTYPEEFEIGESHEKISVPEFGGRQYSKFVHDFKTNKTGIVDVNGRKCFVIPLNRTEVLPPDNLTDLVKKMKQGYYDVDTTIIRETMRVVTPAIEDRLSLGMYINRECAEYPIYTLEKFNGGVYKRSISDKKELKFAAFAGKYTKEISIFDFDVVPEPVPVALA